MLKYASFAATLALCVASSFARADSADLINGLKKHPVTLPLQIGTPFPPVVAGATPALTGNPVADVTNAITNGEANITSALQPIIDFVTSDFSSAQQLAVQAGDGNAAACWGAMSPIATLIKAHPLPATLHLATDFQALRSLQIQLKALCENAACTQVFSEESAQISAFGLGMPIPSLSAACAKITPISIKPVAVAAAPVVMPSAVPSPSPTAN